MSKPDEERDIPVIEEEAHVEKRSVETGRVRVSARTHVFEETVGADLMQEAVEVFRVPLNRVVDAAPAIRTEGNVTIVPVMEEIAVVETRLVLREEIHIRRTASSHHVDTPVSLRRQDVRVERAEAED
jgi:stress response protein YsnF